jgi:ketosteroid isomerase-like protein
MKHTHDAARLATDYLAAVERRDLDTASSMLAPNARLVFTGATQLDDLHELVSRAGRRYTSIEKQIDRVDVAELADEAAVYISGSLQGVNLHGVPFSGVRFIDRIAVRDGKIVSQEVWNDLADLGVLDTTE